MTALASPALLLAMTVVAGVGGFVTATNWCLSSFIYGLLHRRQAGEATI